MQTRSTFIAAAILSGIFATSLSAQWPRYREAGAPRTPDGKVNVNAPAPKFFDGHPDLSGIWENPGWAEGAAAGGSVSGTGGAPGSRSAENRRPPASILAFFDVGTMVPGGLPYTPWARELRNKRFADNAKDNPDAHCLPLGNMQLHLHPQPRKIIQAPNVIVMLYQGNAGVRQIFMFWYYLTYLAGSLIASFFFYFSSVFPTRERSFTLGDHLLTWGFPSLLLCLMPIPQVLIREIVSQPSGWAVVLEKPAFWTYSFWLTLLMGRAFVHLFQKYQRASGRPKMQLRYVLFGTAISTFFGSTFNLVLPGVGNTQWIWLGPLFTIMLVVSTAYAIVKHRLMDIRVIFNRAIVYSIFLIITLALYTMVVLTSQQFFKDTTGVVASLLIGSVLIALGLEPLRKLIQKTTDRIFFKGEFAPQQLLATVTDTLSSIADLEKRLHIVASRLTTDFRAERVAFWIFDQNLNQVDLKVLEGDPMLLENFSPDTLLHYFTAASVGEYVRVPQRRESLLYDYDDDTEGPLSGQSDPDPILVTAFDEMKRLGMDLIIPISSKDTLVGLLLMGPKRSGELYFNDDLKLLGIIAQEAGIAIDNARLYHRLQHQMEELKTMQSHQLLQSAKLATIGELATNIAHEINNPLTSILGFTTLLLKVTGESDPRRKDLKIIESEAMRSRDIVRNLLDFARSKEPKKEPLDINDIIHNTLALIRYYAEKSNITIKEEYQEVPKVPVDASQMKQVFINMIKNSLEAMTQGGQLWIKTRWLLKEQQVEILFEDSGCGIHPEHLTKIFDPFFTTKGDTIGTGIGLAVSAGIIKRHGGEVSVESTVGQGSRFYIRLPLEMSMVGKDA